MKKSLLFINLVFVVVAATFVLFRSPILLSEKSMVATQYDYHWDEWQSICAGTSRPCLRVTAAAATAGLEFAAQSVFRIFYWDVQRSPIEPPTYEFAGENRKQYLQQIVIPFASITISQVLFLYPILLVSCLLFRNNFLRMVGFLAIFAGAFGWHPVFVSSFFSMMQPIIQWPSHLFLFIHQLYPYDWLALGWVAFAIWYSVSAGRLDWRSIVVISFLAQLTLEHLGFVTGVIMAITAAFGQTGTLKTKVQEGIRCLAIAGTTSVCALLASVLVFGLMGFEALTPQELEDKNWIQNNFFGIKIFIANLLTIMIMAFAGGFACGVVATSVGHRYLPDRAGVERLLVAGLAGVIALLISGVVGLWFLAYPSEMGRQFAPLGLSTAIFGLAAGQYTVARIKGVWSTEATS